MEWKKYSGVELRARVLPFGDLPVGAVILRCFEQGTEFFVKIKADTTWVGRRKYSESPAVWNARRFTPELGETDSVETVHFEDDALVSVVDKGSSTGIAEGMTDVVWCSIDDRLDSGTQFKIVDRVLSQVNSSEVLNHPAPLKKLIDMIIDERNHVIEMENVPACSGIFQVTPQLINEYTLLTQEDLGKWAYILNGNICGISSSKEAAEWKMKYAVALITGDTSITQVDIGPSIVYRHNGEVKVFSSDIDTTGIVVLSLKVMKDIEYPSFDEICEYLREVV